MKVIKRCVSVVLVCALFMATSSFAAARASDQIDSYSINATATTDGRIAIKFSVTGTNIMNCLGAQSIYIYERSANGLEMVASFDQNDSGMTKENAIKFSNAIDFYGEVGTEYRIAVTVFAEDQNGDSDSRSKTLTVTAR